jgi:hypothetical protein
MTDPNSDPNSQHIDKEQIKRKNPKNLVKSRNVRYDKTQIKGKNEILHLPGN